jgi:hypothetical protein
MDEDMNQFLSKTEQRIRIKMKICIKKQKI